MKIDNLDNLLSEATLWLPDETTEIPYIQERALASIACTFLALVKMLKEIEDDGRGDPEP